MTNRAPTLTASVQQGTSNPGQCNEARKSNELVAIGKEEKNIT